MGKGKMERLGTEGGDKKGDVREGERGTMGSGSW